MQVPRLIDTINGMLPGDVVRGNVAPGRLLLAAYSTSINPGPLIAHPRRNPANAAERVNAALQHIHSPAQGWSCQPRKSKVTSHSWQAVQTEAITHAQAVLLSSVSSQTSVRLVQIDASNLNPE